MLLAPAPAAAGGHERQQQQQQQRLFSDLHVYVLSVHKDVEAAQTAALIAKLQTHGAIVATRAAHRATTHVVVQQSHAPAAAEKADGDARLREVFTKIVDQVRASGDASLNDPRSVHSTHSTPTDAVCWLTQSSCHHPVQSWCAAAAHRPRHLCMW